MYTPRGLSVGDHVTITRDLANGEGTFAAGHRFQIIDIHFHGGATRTTCAITNCICWATCRKKTWCAPTPIS